MKERQFYTKAPLWHLFFVLISYTLILVVFFWYLYNLNWVFVLMLLYFVILGGLIFINNLGSFHIHFKEKVLGIEVSTRGITQHVGKYAKTLFLWEDIKSVSFDLRNSRFCIHLKENSKYYKQQTTINKLVLFLTLRRRKKIICEPMDLYLESIDQIHSFFETNYNQHLKL